MIGETRLKKFKFTKDNFSAFTEKLSKEILR